MNKERLLIDEELTRDGRTVVLGISGGPDSVCLLYELLAHGANVVCAHVNHHLRGEDSDGDEAWVKALCEKLGVVLEVLHIDAAALAKEKGMTIEEAGREARYAFFDEVCEAQGGNAVIALAHNRDDQSETVLMRIIRGTGTDGLAGMAKRRKSAAGFEILRPLLEVPREEIEKRLAGYGVSARTDESNSDTGYLRNKLRLEVFPYLKEEQGLDLKQGLLRLSENAAEDKDYFDAVIEEALDEYLEYPETEFEHKRDGSFCVRDRTQKEPSLLCSTMPAEVLCGVHPAIRHRLIRAAFAELGLDKDIAGVHLFAADGLLETWQSGGEASGKRVEFPRDFTFGISGKKAVFRAAGVVEPGWKPRRKL